MLAKKSNSKNGYSASTRQEAFDLLNKNPLLTPKSLCKLMDLPYEKYFKYLNRLRYEWKSNHKNEHGSKCSIHTWRGWCYVPSGLDKTEAVKQGWSVSRARNRWLARASWRDFLQLIERYHNNPPGA